MKRHCKKLTLEKMTAILMLSLCLNGSGAARESVEMENLAAISEELSHLIRLTHQFRQAAARPKDARIQFRYDALIARLTSIQNDIGKHIRWVQANPKWERLHID